MKRITKDELIKKFGENCSCEVTYKDLKKVKYDSFKHVNWKNIHKITVEFKSPHYHKDEKGDLNKRNGVAYLLIDN